MVCGVFILRKTLFFVRLRIMIHIEIAAEKIGSIFGFSVTNTLLMIWITMVVLGGLSFLMYRRLSPVPSALQGVFEFFVDTFIGTLESVFGSRIKAEKYFPMIATIFLMVLISNWLGIFPGVGTIGLAEERDGHQIFVPLFRSTASDLNFTLALAIISVCAVNIFGIAAIGIGKHISRFISFKGPIDFFVGMLELISEIAKMISFSFRLFGNIFAGEVLLVVMAFLAPFIIPAPFLFLEVFVGFVQALVFAMLTSVFISIATAEHH